MVRALEAVFTTWTHLNLNPWPSQKRAVHLTAMVSEGPRAEPPGHAATEAFPHAALTRVSPRDSVLSCPSRSAASSHLIQREAHGTAARRFGLIADSHSTQVPKPPL